MRGSNLAHMPAALSQAPRYSGFSLKQYDKETKSCWLLQRIARQQVKSGEVPVDSTACGAAGKRPQSPCSHETLDFVMDSDLWKFSTMKRSLLLPLRTASRPIPTFRSRPAVVRHGIRALASAADLQFGQPLHETHPHLINSGDREPHSTMSKDVLLMDS